MSIKKLVIGVSMSLLLAGCGSSRYSGYPGTLSESDTQLGSRYLLGHGVPQSNERAFYYFSQAASDDPLAQNEVAYLYAAGKGTAQNDGMAFKYYQQAANHGLASAQYNLGLLYLHGLGTPPNKEMAIHWFQKSAAHGFEPARLMLAQYR